MTKTAVNVECFVIGFRGRAGILLLRHRSEPDLRKLAKRYRESRDDYGFWIVPFDWESLSLTNRKELALAFATRADGVLVANLIVGRAGICTAEKINKWRALELDLKLSGPVITLPARRRLQKPKSAVRPLSISMPTKPAPCEKPRQGMRARRGCISPFVPGDETADQWRIHGC